MRKTSWLDTVPETIMKEALSSVHNLPMRNLFTITHFIVKNYQTTFLST